MTAKKNNDLIVQLTIEAFKCHIYRRMNLLPVHQQLCDRVNPYLLPLENKTKIQNVWSLWSEKITVPIKREPKHNPERTWTVLSGREKEHDTEKRQGSPVRRCVARHEATVYIPAAKNSIPGHCDSSQASHVTQSCLVPGCRLNSSASVQWRACLQSPGEGESSQGPDSAIEPTHAGV